MRPLEKTIENRVVDYARKRGWEVVKLNGMGKRSHPDRMFLGRHGVVVFIEFKRPGAQPTPLQRHLHEKWGALGHHVHVLDNSILAMRLLEREARHATRRAGVER